MNKDERADPSKIKQDEWIPITVLNLEKRKIGWSPKLKKSVFIDGSTDYETIQELKRVREVDILTVYDQLKDRTMFIELRESEKEWFDEIYAQYLEVGGQILYTRKKEGRKTHTLFMLDEEYGKMAVSDVPEKKSLFE